MRPRTKTPRNTCGSCYGHTPATIEEVKKANRAADALVEKARRVRGPAHAR